MNNKIGMAGTDTVLKWLMWLALVAVAGLAFRNIFLKLG